MKIKQSLLAYFLILTVFISYTHATFAQSEEEELEEATPVTEIEPDALRTSTRTYDEGITVKEIELSGNMLVPEERILSTMKIKEGSIFDREAVQEDLRNIYGMGYFTDNIKVVPEATPKGIKLRIELEENVPVTGINIKGNNVLNTAEIEEIFRDQTGLPQNIAQLNESIEKLEKKYAEKGFVLARVKSITDDPDGMVNIEITEGVVNKIHFVGNTKTKDFVIKRNMLLTEGNIYNELVLKDDLKRIYSTQAFEDVRRVVSASPEDPDKFDLSVEVDEKRTGSISLGGGVDTGAGLFGSLGYQNPNFLGRGQMLSATMMAGTGFIYRDRAFVRRPYLQFDTTFSEPRVNNTLNSLSVNAFGRNYASFQIPLSTEQRIGGEIEWARPITSLPNTAATVSFGFENVNIEEADSLGAAFYYSAAGIDIAERAKQLEGGSYFSISPGIAYDSRDNRLNPTKGWFTSLKVTEGLGVSGDIGHFTKLLGNVRKYIPITEKVTLALNAQAGSSLLGEIPEFNLFRIGGGYTVRGFREGAIGSGGQFILGSAEIRAPLPFIDRFKKIPMVDSIRTALFVDAGQIYQNSVSDTLFDRPGYGISAGAGLRVNIPAVGPVRIDYGIPLTDVGNYYSKSGRFNFGFGEKF